MLYIILVKARKQGLSKTSRLVVYFLLVHVFISSFDEINLYALISLFITYNFIYIYIKLQIDEI